MADPGALSSTISQISITSGTGSYLIDRNILDKLPFSAAYTTGDTLRYHATDTSGMSEDVIGVFTTSPDTLTRDTLILSSTGSFISWPATGQRVITPLVGGFFTISFSLGGEFGDMSPDELDGNYEIFDCIMPFRVVFPANMTSSPTPGCEIAPGTDVSLIFQTIHAGSYTNVGTLDIATSSLTGTFTTPALNIPVGDRLRLYAPSSVDGTIAGAFATLLGFRA